MYGTNTKGALMHTEPLRWPKGRAPTCEAGGVRFESCSGGKTYLMANAGLIMSEWVALPGTGPHYLNKNNKIKYL